MNAQYLSPALVGDGIFEHRIQSNIRTQMFANNNVSNTIVVSWDSHLRKEYNETNNFRYGLQVISDQLGNGIIKTNYFTFNIANRIVLDDNMNHSIALGLSATYANSILDENKLRLGDQLNHFLTGITSTTGGIPTTDILLNRFPNGTTFNAGLAYKYITDNFYLQTGTGAFFYSIPNIAKGIPGGSKIEMKNSIFLNTEKNMNEKFSVLLQAYFSNRFNLNKDLSIGCGIGVPIYYKDEEDRRLYINFQYRFNEAYIPNIVYLLDKYTFGISYDVYLNKITTSNLRQNSFELSFSKSFGQRKKYNFRSIFN
jgi:hypothetical protein